MTDPVDAVARLLATRQPACGTTTVVAIDGPSGSGKSELATRIGERTGAHVLRVDTLVPGWHGLAQVPHILRDEVLAPIAVGEVARPSVWSWVRDEPGPRRPVPSTSVLLLDGCGSGSRVVRPFLSGLVWIDGPEDVRHARAMARDGETYEPWWDVWAAQERRLFSAEGTAAAADLHIELTR